LIPERFRQRHDVLGAGYFHNPEPRAMGAGLEPMGRRADGSEFAVDVTLSPLAAPTGSDNLALARIRIRCAG